MHRLQRLSLNSLVNFKKEVAGEYELVLGEKIDSFIII